MVLTTKPPSSLSLDLDNQWSYMKTHGDAGWDTFPSYLDLVVPRILDFLDRYGWSITFFVVGQDAALEPNREVLQRIVESGHEVGNHSFHHEPWLQIYSDYEIEAEIFRAHDAITSAAGVEPSGFRGPGYSLSPSTLEVVSRIGYPYDASTFPTYLGPLARAYYFLTSDFDDEEKARRKALFGGLRDGFRPLRPFLWALDDVDVLEIPVTTMPVTRLPFHFSYLLYISTYAEHLAILYFKAALRLCRLMRVEPSLLLHPLDFLGHDDVSELTFFPAMSESSHFKLAMMHRFMNIVEQRHTVISVGRHARLLRNSASLRRVQPNRYSRSR